MVSWRPKPPLNLEDVFLPQLQNGYKFHDLDDSKITMGKYKPERDNDICERSRIFHFREARKTREWCLVNPRGGTPLYKVYRYVPPQRVWFLSRFGLKTGIDFEHLV